MDHNDLHMDAQCKAWRLKVESPWAELDDDKCPCRGTGWAQVDVEQWKTCSIHFEGQLHPETRTLLLDDPPLLKEEERKAKLKFQINEKKLYIADMQKLVIEGQTALAKLELELTNRTPTIRGMPAIRPEAYPTVRAMPAVRPPVPSAPEIEVLPSDGDWL